MLYSRLHDATEHSKAMRTKYKNANTQKIV
jgi:hypothetical protein